MSEETGKRQYVIKVDENTDKVTLVIDPVSIPLELAEDVSKGIIKEAKKLGKKLNKLFK